MNRSLLNEVAAYYSGKIRQHGATPKGVDWNSKEGQELRFAQLVQVVNVAEPFSVNDLGCGYGALLAYLNQYFESFSYCGIDITSEMIVACKDRFLDECNADFILANSPNRVADYGLASGIFSVKQEQSNADWEEYILNTLESLNLTSTRGFAFNCLTSYSDSHKMRKDLYYADPLWLFDICKRNFSRHVRLLHDYGLYEFTIIVRK